MWCKMLHQLVNVRHRWRNMLVMAYAFFLQHLNEINFPIKKPRNQGTDSAELCTLILFRHWFLCGAIQYIATVQEMIFIWRFLGWFCFTNT